MVLERWRYFSIMAPPMAPLASAEISQHATCLAWSSAVPQSTFDLSGSQLAPLFLYLAALHSQNTPVALCNRSMDQKKKQVLHWQ